MDYTKSLRSRDNEGQNEKQNETGLWILENEIPNERDDKMENEMATGPDLGLGT